jgi:hypothetical protein
MRPVVRVCVLLASVVVEIDAFVVDEVVTALLLPIVSRILLSIFVLLFVVFIIVLGVVELLVVFALGSVGEVVEVVGPLAVLLVEVASLVAPGPRLVPHYLLRLHSPRHYYSYALIIKLSN